MGDFHGLRSFQGGYSQATILSIVFLLLMTWYAGPVLFVSMVLADALVFILGIFFALGLFFDPFNTVRCFFFGGGRWLLPCFRDGVLAENKWTRRRKLQDIFFYLKMFWRVFNPQKDWVNTIQWVYLGILLDKSRCYRWSHTTIATFHIDKSEILIWKSCKWQVQDLVRLIMRAQKKDQWPAWTLGRTWYTAGPSVVLRCAGTMKSQIIVRGSNHAQKNFPILMAKYGCPVCVDEVIGKDRIEQKAKSFECVVG